MIMIQIFIGAFQWETFILNIQNFQRKNGGGGISDLGDASPQIIWFPSGVKFSRSKILNNFHDRDEIWLEQNLTSLGNLIGGNPRQAVCWHSSNWRPIEIIAGNSWVETVRHRFRKSEDSSNFFDSGLKMKREKKLRQVWICRSIAKKMKRFPVELSKFFGGRI